MYNSGSVDQGEPHAQQPDYPDSWNVPFPPSRGPNADPEYSRYIIRSGYAISATTPLHQVHDPFHGAPAVAMQQVAPEGTFHFQVDSLTMSPNFHHQRGTEPGFPHFQVSESIMGAIPPTHTPGPDYFSVPQYHMQHFPRASYPYPPPALARHRDTERRISDPSGYLTRTSGAVESDLGRQQGNPHVLDPTYPGQNNSPRTTPSVGSIGGSPGPAHTESFIQESFPGVTAEDERLRVELTTVMSAEWKINHAMEPNEAALLQFTSYDQKRGRWSCRFSKDGQLCLCSTKKKDHAKGHIRWHIDHRPFFCNECEPNCGKQYTAMESLKKHRDGKARCDLCGVYLLKGNLQRHRNASCKVVQNSETSGLSS